MLVYWPNTMVLGSMHLFGKGTLNKAGVNVRIEGEAQTDGVDSRFSKSSFPLRGPGNLALPV